MAYRAHVLSAISHRITFSSFRVYLPSKFTMTIASITARTTTPATTITNLLYCSRIASHRIEMENGQSNSIIGLKYQTIVIYGCFHSTHTHEKKNIDFNYLFMFSVCFSLSGDAWFSTLVIIFLLTLNFVHSQLWHNKGPNRIEFDDGAYQNGHSKL